MTDLCMLQVAPNVVLSAGKSNTQSCQKGHVESTAIWSCADPVIPHAAHCWFEGAAARNGTFSPGYSAAVQPRRPFGFANIMSVKLPTGMS